MSNSTVIFDTFNNILSGKLDGEIIDLPNDCRLILKTDCSSIGWWFEIILPTTQKIIGKRNSRADAFDAAMNHLANYIN